MYRDIPEDLRSLIEPVATDHGFEIVDVVFRGGRPGGRLVVIVDTPQGDGRVAVGACAALARELSTCLDASGLMDARYTLEVTSPGLDRVLGREKDFESVCGETVKLETRELKFGSRKFRGKLMTFVDGDVTLLVDGTQRVIPFADVIRANKVYEYTSEDFSKARGDR